MKVPTERKKGGERRSAARPRQSRRGRSQSFATCFPLGGSPPLPLLLFFSFQFFVLAPSTSVDDVNTALDGFVLHMSYDMNTSAVFLDSILPEEGGDGVSVVIPCQRREFRACSERLSPNGEERHSW